MPLKCGKQNVGRNIAELMRTGRPQKQAVAIALSHVRRCASGKISRRTGRSKNRPMRGFKKCVMSCISRAKADTPVSVRKSFMSAVKKCKKKFT